MEKNKASLIKEYWNSPDTVSLKDDNLRELESRAITRWLHSAAIVLDVGCGDGINTMLYGDHVKQILGVDYASTMINKASARLSNKLTNNIEFRNLSVGSLDQLESFFDIVISQRCLINLSSFEEQKSVIKDIHSVLNPGGIYLMLEAFQQGRENLNGIRATLGLDPLSMPWHNLFLDEELLHNYIKDYFEIICVEDFSTYYLITRTINQLMDLGLNDPISASLDLAATRLQSVQELGVIKGIGPQRLYVLKKLP